MEGQLKQAQVNGSRGLEFRRYPACVEKVQSAQIATGMNGLHWVLGKLFESWSCSGRGTPYQNTASMRAMIQGDGYELYDQKWMKKQKRAEGASPSNRLEMEEIRGQQPFPRQSSGRRPFWSNVSSAITEMNKAFKFQTPLWSLAQDSVLKGIV